MKKEKLIYKYKRYEGSVTSAKKEIPFEFRLSSRMILDEICFQYNKQRIEASINQAIASGNKEQFMQSSEAFKQFIWE
ncbi:IDEAL domain-containing protein [Oceanobacillus manasiensis]|uniref:IDEAL domain-containing protein n=1 Tax=Oceanobacillus manasiensis TaxID=586413 RepID=UPI0005A7887B|nr:IDEAL domain-containing protein [Oceanobacillus manasiensis]